MGWKEFLKPEREKIIIFFIFLISMIFGNFYYYIIFRSSNLIIGLPVPFFASQKFFYLELVFDIIFWYFISCLSIWEVKRKK